MTKIINVNSGAKKLFSDVKPEEPIFFIDPANGKIKFFKVTSTKPDQVIGMQLITFYLVEGSESLVNEVDEIKSDFKMGFEPPTRDIRVKKDASMVLTATTPPTVYCTTRKELTNWMLSTI